MALKICEHCGKAWLDDGGEIRVSLCPLCTDYLDTLYMQAWSYLRDSAAEGGRQRKITAAQLAEELDVEPRSIDLLVKIGKIQTSSSSEPETRSGASAKELDALRKIRKGLRGSSRYGRRER